MDEPTPRDDLPYNRFALARDGSMLLGLSAENIFAASQRLYESEFISYPRSDCQYLPSNQRSEMLNVLEKLPRELTDEDASEAIFRDIVFDDAKAEVHHAIVPIGKIGSVPMADRALYNLIVWRFARTVFA